ncbi:MAG: response regulator transcription factor [Acidobacteriota bacterium]
MQELTARDPLMNETVAVARFRKLGLSHREAEVLLWIARGRSNAEIGASLCISPLTVKKHLERVYRKLGVKTRLAASVCAGEACLAGSRVDSDSAVEKLAAPRRTRLR